MPSKVIAVFVLSNLMPVVLASEELDLNIVTVGGWVFLDM